MVTYWYTIIFWHCSKQYRYPSELNWRFYLFLGSLSFAALDSVPHDLVDNAAIVGTVSLVTAGLFLLDMGGPKAKKPRSEEKMKKKKSSESSQRKSISQQLYDIERGIENSEKKHLDTFEKIKKKPLKEMNGVNGNGTKNGAWKDNGMEMEPPKKMNGIYIYIYIIKDASCTVKTVCFFLFPIVNNANYNCSYFEW